LENRFSEMHILLRGGDDILHYFSTFFSAQLDENSVDEIHTKFSSAVLRYVKIGVVKFTSCSFTLPSFTLPNLT
jgi:hypothetical protein